MAKRLKKVISLLLVICCLITTPLNALAFVNGEDATSVESSGKGLSWKFVGFGFRMYICNTDINPYKIEGNTYRSRWGMASVLEKQTEINGAIYFGDIDDKTRFYDMSAHSWYLIDKNAKIIDTSDVTKCPGLGAYKRVTVKDKDSKSNVLPSFEYYADYFNKLQDYCMNGNSYDTDKYDKILKWFKDNGANKKNLTSNDKHAMIVVEPYAVWKPSGSTKSYIMTYQQIRYSAEVGQNKSPLRLVTNGWSTGMLKKMKITKQKDETKHIWTTWKSASVTYKYLNHFGNFYEGNGLFGNNLKCSTEARTRTSGYAYFGIPADATSGDYAQGDVTVIYRGEVGEDGTDASDFKTYSAVNIVQNNELDYDKLRRTVHTAVSSKNGYLLFNGATTEPMKHYFPDSKKLSISYLPYDEYGKYFGGEAREMDKSTNDKGNVTLAEGNAGQDYVLEAANIIQMTLPRNRSISQFKDALVLDKSKFKISWGDYTVSSGNINAGSKHSIKRLDYDDNGDLLATSSIVRGIASNLAKTGQAKYSVKERYSLANNSDNFGEEDALEKLDNKIYKNSAYSYAFMVRSLSDLYNDAKTTAHEDLKEKGFKEGSKVNISVKFFAKTPRVWSYLCHIHRDKNGKVTMNDVKAVNYSISDDREFDLPSVGDNHRLIIIPNYDSKSLSRLKKDPQELLSAIKSVGEGTSAVSTFTSYFSGSTVNTSRSVSGGETVGVGSEQKTEGGTHFGYSVYYYTEDEPKSIPKGGLELEDYELNYVFRDIVDDGLKKVNYLMMTPFGYYSSTVCPEPESPRTQVGNQTISCPDCCSPLFANVTPISWSYTIRVFDFSSGNGVVGHDNSYGDAQGVTRYLLYNEHNNSTPKSDGGYTKWAVRGKLLRKAGYDTQSNNPYYYNTYAANLSRHMFGDYRTVSSISLRDQTISTSFAQNLLKLSYGNKPKSVKKVSPIRNSNALIKTLTDNIRFEACYAAEGNCNRETFGSSKIKWNKHYYVYSEPRSLRTHTRHTGHKVNHGSWTDKKGVVHHYTYITHTSARTCSHPHSYYITPMLVEKKELLGFLEEGNLRRSISVIVHEKGYKYMTERMNKGVSGVKDGMNDHVNSQTASYQSKIKKEFASSIIKNFSGITLNYYPEVRMRAYEYSGDKIKSVNSSVYPLTVLTMAEVIRQTTPNAMYIVSTNNGTASNAVTGKTTSNTLVTNSNDLPTVYSGSDVSLSIKETGFGIEVFGYVADVIDKNKDSVMKLSETQSIKYTDVVNDNSNVYKDWGNSGTSAKYLDDFKAFVKDVTDVKKIGIDMDLEVDDGKLKYNNFSTSFGKFSDKNPREEYVYPLYFQYGKVDQTSVGYKALIKQIAKDYKVSYGEARQLFEKSGICEGILSAIESSTSSVNKSQDGSSARLGSNRHWYDEEVKTIVIRRYRTDNIHLKGVMLNDKVDYNNSVNHMTQAGINRIITGENVTGKWYLNVYLKKLPKYYNGVGVIYEPKKGNKSEAEESGTVFVNHLYVKGADFYVAPENTENMGF